LLASLLKQLSEKQTPIPSATNELYKEHQSKGTRPSTDELFNALKSIARSSSRTFIIVDALDECQISDGSRTRFLEYSFALQTQCEANVLITSRFLPGITEKFDEASTLEIRAAPEDVHNYLAGQMFRLPRFISIQDDIESAIVEAVDGM
jgi:hypothetical protein